MSRPLRLGLMVPINNTTMERELLAWSPPGSTCATIRIPRGAGLLTEQTLPAYREQAKPLASRFNDSDLDVIAYGCTSASFLSGPATDSALAAELSEITKKPVVTTAQSMVRTMRDAEAGDIALVTPYSDAVNRQLTLYLEESGISVRKLASFHAADVDALGRISADEVLALATSTMSMDCGGLFVACSQLPTFAIFDRLRTLSEPKPASSSVHATAMQVEHAVGT